MSVFVSKNCSGFMAPGFLSMGLPAPLRPRRRAASFSSTMIQSLLSFFLSVLRILTQVATAMVNLGRVLEEKGQYTDALIYLRKGLTIREKVLEEGHPDTISALAWIGVSGTLVWGWGGGQVTDAGRGRERERGIGFTSFEPVCDDHLFLF